MAHVPGPGDPVSAVVWPTQVVIDPAIGLGNEFTVIVLVL